MAQPTAIVIFQIAPETLVISGEIPAAFPRPSATSSDFARRKPREHFGIKRVFGDLNSRVQRFRRVVGQDGNLAVSENF